MSGPIDAVRMRGAPNLPQEMPAEVPVPSVAPSPEEAQAAANRMAREQFVNTLVTMEGISPRFLDYVRERLGLEGRPEVASQPLETREVNEIMADAQKQSAVVAMQVSAVLTDQVDREIKAVHKKEGKESLELSFEYLHMLSLSCSKVKSMALLCLTILRMVEVVVKLRSDIAKYRSACKLATAKEKAESSRLKIRELIEQIKEALIELDEKIQSLKREIKEESSLNDALQAAAAKHLESEISAWRKLVSGFESREERLHGEVRDEMEEIAEEREICV